MCLRYSLATLPYERILLFSKFNSFGDIPVFNAPHNKVQRWSRSICPSDAMCRGRLNFSASDYLTSTLSNPESGHSYDASNTAFQQAIGKKQSLFDWMQEKVSETEDCKTPLRRYKSSTEETISSNLNSPAEKLVPRPELGLFHSAMKGLSRGQFCTYDFPWDQLNESATVVDVGGGIGESRSIGPALTPEADVKTGSFCMELHASHPTLKLIVQDRAAVVEQGISAWRSLYPASISQGRVQLAAHDFFDINPVLGADVYWLRYVMYVKLLSLSKILTILTNTAQSRHDWPDAEAIVILSQIAKSMGPNSRLLIADMIINTTLGSNEVESAPEPLLKNYGHAMGIAHMMDINMMMMVNGIERTPAGFRSIIGASGLMIYKIWDCRGPLSIVECRLAHAAL